MKCTIFSHEHVKLFPHDMHLRHSLERIYFQLFPSRVPTILARNIAIIFRIDTRWYAYKRGIIGQIVFMEFLNISIYVEKCYA